MNSDLFSEALPNDLSAAATNPWDKLWPLDQMPAAVAAYHRTKEQNRMAREPEPTDATIILSGVHSCVLAKLVLDTEFKDPNTAHAQALRTTAIKVLDNWGLRLEKDPPIGVTKPEPTPEPAASLVWPPVDRLGRPLTTVLPDVYRENYYHVREAVVVPNPDDNLSGIHVLPEKQLVLYSGAYGTYWHEENMQWRMRFHIDGDDRLFWLDHCKVRVGDEIPKIIDAATQARSNDP